MYDLVCAISGTRYSIHRNEWALTIAEGIECFAGSDEP